MTAGTLRQDKKRGAPGVRQRQQIARISNEGYASVADFLRGQVIFFGIHRSRDSPDINNFVDIEANAGLGFENSPGAVVEALLFQASVSDCCHQGIKGDIGVRRHEENIHTCLDGTNCSLARGEAVGDALHFQGVGDQQALEAHFVPENPRHQFGGQGCRAA